MVGRVRTAQDAARDIKATFTVVTPNPQPGNPIVTFATPEAHAAWRDDAAHRAAQQEGRDVLYEWYSVQVSTCTGATHWQRPPG